MNQNPFPSCQPSCNNFVGTATYTAKCHNGTEFHGGFDWIKTGTGIEKTISGLVLLRKTVSGWVFLAAHDASSSPRLSRIEISNTGAVTSSDVEWSGPPIDIEALFVHQDNIFAASSSGTLYRIALDANEENVSTIDSVYFGAMISGANCEAAFIHETNGIFILVVASRGDDLTPSTIAWRRVVYPSLSLLGDTESITFSAPFPTSNVRHVSDIRIDIDGNVFVSSASDPGDDGPFSSAVYHIGSMYAYDSFALIAKMQTPREAYRSTSHKVEAICLTPNDSLGMILGADDENSGGFIFIQGQRVTGIPVGDPVTITRQAWSSVSAEDAQNKARELARLEAVSVLACRYVARDCATPQCGNYFYAPVCCYGTGATASLAADKARADALAWAALYCPP